MIEKLNGCPIVKCDGCGEVIDACGWLGYDIEEHYCDDCYANGKAEGRADEFCICMECGMPMVEGYTDDGTFYACEGCFDAAMLDYFGEYREVDDDGCNGYYEWFEPRECTWNATGVYWTQWY